MMLLTRLAILAACTMALNANAAYVRGAVSATGPSNAGSPLSHLIDQSGLAAGYTSGVTDFDSYVAGTTHNSTRIATTWNLTGTGAAIFDLGGSFDISGLALWNRGPSDQGLKDFALYSCADAACAAEQLIGNFVAANGLGSDSLVQAQTITFAEINTGFFKLEVQSTYNRINISTLGELVFREEAAASGPLPEPASLALVGLALGSLGVARRRRPR